MYWCEACWKPVEEKDLFLPRIDRRYLRIPFLHWMGYHERPVEVSPGVFENRVCHGPVRYSHRMPEDEVEAQKQRLGWPAGPTGPMTRGEAPKENLPDA